YAGDDTHPLLPALDQADVHAETLTAASPAALAAELVARASSIDGTVVWCLGEDGDPGLARALGTRVTTAPENAPEVELLPGSYDQPGARFQDLVEVMDRLRSPGGCPWDREQTHESLVRYLLEEAYEVAEAVETGDRAALREELGDVLMQVVFHARIAMEHPDEAWTVDDVAGDIVDKLVRRHPHVFGDDEAPVGEQMQARWDELKAQEKGRTSAVDGVPLAQPALALASKLIGRAERAGLDLPVPAPEEVDAADVGGLLFAVVAQARQHGVDPEQALRHAARDYRDRVTAAERSSRT
ncbi:MAG TPA: MazG family protein, partial [Streptosporangiales bacterium]